MIYPIVAYGNPILRKKAIEVTPEMVSNLSKLTDDMYQTMYAASGVGLAAPQIGLNFRIFITDGQGLNGEKGEKDYDPSLENFKIVFINPVMIKQEGEKWAFNEGCLSLPNLREDISRPSIITIQYQDVNWNKHTQTFSGLAARIIQHEFDHLEGVLFIDYISSVRKQIIKKELNSIKKGLVKVKYKIDYYK